VFGEKVTVIWVLQKREASAIWIGHQPKVSFALKS